MAFLRHGLCGQGVHLQQLTLAGQCLHGLAGKAWLAELEPSPCETYALVWEPWLLAAKPGRGAAESLCCGLPYYVLDLHSSFLS